MVFWEKAKAYFPLDCLYPVRLLFLNAICRKKDKGKLIVFECVAMGLRFCLKWDALCGERTISGTWILTKTACSVSCHVVFLAIFCEWIRFGDSEISFWISSFDYRLLSKTLSYIWMSTELTKGTDETRRSFLVFISLEATESSDGKIIWKCELFPLSCEALRLRF